MLEFFSNAKLQLSYFKNYFFYFLLIFVIKNYFFFEIIFFFEKKVFFYAIIFFMNLLSNFYIILSECVIIISIILLWPKHGYSWNLGFLILELYRGYKGVEGQSRCCAPSTRLGSRAEGDVWRGHRGHRYDGFDYKMPTTHVKLSAT